MLSVELQKDISDYKPKIFGGLTSRSLFCIITAIGISVLVAVYCHFALGIPPDIWMFLIIIISFPIWAIGFWRPYGMEAEKFVPLWLKHNFGKNKVFYISSDILNGFSDVCPTKKIVRENEFLTGHKVDKHYELLCKRPDFEAYDPDIDMGLSSKELELLPPVNMSVFQQSIQGDKEKFLKSEAEKLTKQETDLSNSGKIRLKQKEDEDLLLAQGFLKSKGVGESELNNVQVFKKENLALGNQLPEIFDSSFTDSKTELITDDLDIE